MNRLSTDVNFTALVKPAKGGNPAERYVFVWHDDQRQELLRTFGRFASNPELSYTWGMRR